MQLYPYLLLAHVVSALTLFACEGVATTSVQMLKRTRDTEGVRNVLSVMKRTGSAGRFAPPLLLVTGLVLSFSAWGGLRLAWVNLSLLLFVVIAVGVQIIDSRIFRQLGAAVVADDFGTAQTLAHSRALATLITLRLTALVGLVFLMTLKPPLLPALFGLAVLFFLGFGVALKPDLRRILLPQNRHA